MIFIFIYFYLITLSKSSNNYVVGNIINVKTFSDTPSVSNIVNGKKALKNEFPFMAQLYYLNDNGSPKIKCGGSLLGDRFILTAKHCLRYGLESYKVVVGHTTIISEQNQHKLYSIDEKFSFSAEKVRYLDMVILKLSESVPESEAKSAKIFSRHIRERMSMEVAGFGDTQFKGNHSEILLKTKVHLSTNPKCLIYNENWKKDNNGTVFCVEPKSDTSSCNGDSGGPVVARYRNMNYLVGVVNSGININDKKDDKNYNSSCGKDTLQYYVRVGYFLDRILDITQIPINKLTGFDSSKHIKNTLLSK
ncbi:hypothetical protein BB561_000467 [Smittium simulii]|uniref:Peptidase S1 domain-containing protein n=1 Tax=Smittium simulii TaxID=133385 RepID=A0A2T9YZ20_9FUNG|nr:hypothetical protein BB561_000467 [Smittium simulii]